MQLINITLKVITVLLLTVGLNATALAQNINPEKFYLNLNHQVVKPRVSIGWSGTELTSGVDVDATNGVNFSVGKTFHEINPINVELGVSYVKWNTSSYSRIDASVLYNFKKQFELKGLEMLAGFNFGFSRFSTDLTDASDGGYDAGVVVKGIYPLSGLINVNDRYLRRLKLSVALSHIRTDIHTEKYFPQNNLHRVSLEDINVLNMGVLMGF
jgi:hypothetical protein